MIERERAPHELDGLRWYTDFAACEHVLWERYFYCADLGRDLVPVVEAFRASDEFASGVPGPGAVCAEPPLVQDVESAPPAPFSLGAWLDDHRAALASGQTLDLFPSVPSDLHVTVSGGASHEAHAPSAHWEPPSHTWRPETHVPSWQYQPSTPSAVVHWKPQPISSEPSGQSASPDT